MTEQEQIEKVRVQIRKACTTHTGKPNLNGDMFDTALKSVFSKHINTDSGVLVRLHHDDKNWWGKLVDWVKWKTPLAKYSAVKYTQLKYMTEHDVRAIYISHFYNEGKYIFKRKRVYLKQTISNPYSTYIVNYMPKYPINYITVDFEVKK